MIINYIKIAFRSWNRNRGYTVINLSGLAIGMAMAMIISLWIWDEWNYNRSTKNYKTVGRVISHFNQNGDVVTSQHMPFPLAAELRNNFSQDFEHVSVSWSTEEYNLLFGEAKFRKKGRFMEPDGASILGLEMQTGSEKALNDPASVLISESAAKSIFGNNKPVGQIIKIDNEMEARVAGVFKDFPHNSDYYNLSFVAPWKLFISAKRRQWVKETNDNWDIRTFEILVQTKENISVEFASKKIRNVLVKHLPNNQKPVLALHPMRKWHLYSTWENGINTGGQIYYLKMFGAVAAFILLLACINFMNLSTARSAKRSREVGIRKAVGSKRGQLVFQFITESFLVVAVTFLIAILLVELTLPYFNSFADKEITFLFDGGMAQSPYFLLFSLLLCTFVSLVAGAYPAFYLSSFKPVKILKSGFRHTGRFSLMPRRALVILQFTISVSLIIGTVGVFRQIQFGQERNVGYDRNGLVNVQIPPGSGRLDALKNDLLQSGVVESVAQSSGPVTDILSNARGFDWEGKANGQQGEFAVIAASHSYGKTVGWHIADGRDFAESFISDSSAIIINQSAARYMGLKNPVGKKVRWKDGTFNDSEYHIVGVVKDMIMQSPYEPVKQTIYFMTYAPNFLYIKLNPMASDTVALSKVRGLFDKHLPGSLHDFKFAEDQYVSKFNIEKQIGKLTFLFAAAAIFISCLGLLGLAAFTAEQRKSEIGIRKVLGASIAEVWALIAKEFLLLIVISIFIAVPVSYHFLMQMLSKYHYHSTIPWWIFAGSGFAALVLTLLTISYQAVRAALANPVKSLRSE